MAENNTNCSDYGGDLPADLKQLLALTYLFYAEKYGSEPAAAQHLFEEIQALLGMNSGAKTLDGNGPDGIETDAATDHQHGYLDLVFFESRMSINRCRCHEIPCECGATNSENAITLNFQSWTLVKMLAAAGNNGVTYASLYEAVHRERVDVVDRTGRHSLSQTICDELRPVMSGLGLNPKNMRGFGYRLIEV